MAAWDESYDTPRSEPGREPVRTGHGGDPTAALDPAEEFFRLTRALQERYDIRKAVLIVKEKETSRFCAVASFNDGRTRKNLSLRLPGHSSLFLKVADHRTIFTESYCDLFSGNSFERNLLLDDECRSYAILPLTCDGHVVGILGFSSDSPSTFVTFEEGAVDRAAAHLAERIRQTVTI